MKAIEQIINAVNAVKEGELDALKCYCELKRIEKHLNQALVDIQDEAIEAAEKYGEKTFKAFNCEIQRKSNPGKWDFKHINQIKELNDKLKEYQKLSKNAYKLIEKGSHVYDADGAEIPPARYYPGKDSITIKLI